MSSNFQAIKYLSFLATNFQVQYFLARFLFVLCLTKRKKTFKIGLSCLCQEKGSQSEGFYEFFFASMLRLLFFYLYSTDTVNLLKDRVKSKEK